MQSRFKPIFKCSLYHLLQSNQRWKFLTHRVQHYGGRLPWRQWTYITFLIFYPQVKPLINMERHKNWNHHGPIYLAAGSTATERRLPYDMFLLSRVQAASLYREQTMICLNTTSKTYKFLPIQSTAIALTACRPIAETHTVLNFTSITQLPTYSGWYKLRIPHCTVMYKNYAFYYLFKSPPGTDWRTERRTSGQNP